MIANAPQYLTLEKAYEAAFGIVPSKPTLRRKRERGLRSFFISGAWRTTVEDVLAHETEETESRTHKQVIEQQPRTRSEKAKAKKVAAAFAETDASGFRVSTEA